MPSDERRSDIGSNAARWSVLERDSKRDIGGTAVAPAGALERQVRR